MSKFTIKPKTKTILSDIITPVSIYLLIRDKYPNSALLESSDYNGQENSYSYIGILPIASFKMKAGHIVETYPDGNECQKEVNNPNSFKEAFNSFIDSFDLTNNDDLPFNGLLGYSAYDAVEYFENISFDNKCKEEYDTPEMYYVFYKYILAINHFKNDLTIIDNCIDDEVDNISQIEMLLKKQNVSTYKFSSGNDEKSNITDEEYKEMVAMGKKHCYRGDVFQVVLSRQFSQSYSGDDFNLYRALRSINPSPYLFYFDFGGFRIFGSSPEAQLKITEGRAVINPIAGTYKRTGNDARDKELAQELSKDEKENAEHVMLVDLARNDLSRHSLDVKVDQYRQVQFFSHVLHMVSTVSGKLKSASEIIDMMMATFPAGTLSGAPKYKAMQIIDTYENQRRGYYGGAIGMMGFDGSYNHAIMIRTFLSKDNKLFYQAGAGVVSESDEEKELQEVKNKMGALRKAIDLAKEI